MNSYQRALEDRKKEHLLRSLPLPSQGIDFYSNDYLGLARSSGVQLAIEQEYQKAPRENGATGSRLLSGNNEYYEEIEFNIARFHASEAALVYPSGYTANLGVISCLATKETTLFTDELIHASLIDGARLGHAQKVRFKHNDGQDLAKKLSDTNGQKLVVVESLYSMDGDLCPLKEFVEICEENDAMLLVDEAHAIGVFGKKGEGLVQHLELQNRVMGRIMTFGKAPGIHGAAVVGPKWLRDYQINFSRALIFSTAPSSHQFASIRAMYSQLPTCVDARHKLRENVAYFCERRKESKRQWLGSPSHIQSLIVPGNAEVVSLAKELQREGIIALPIRKPSVAEGAERIRFCIHSFNTKNEIEKLFDLLN